MRRLTFPITTLLSFYPLVIQNSFSFYLLFILNPDQTFGLIMNNELITFRQCFFENLQASKKINDVGIWIIFFIDILFEMIRNINFSISDSEFKNVTSSLTIFDISYGNFSGSNFVLVKCSSLSSYIFYSFNSIMYLDTIGSIAFSNGFFLIQNSTLFMNNSIFNNYQYNTEYLSDLSIFSLQKSASSNKIQVENTLFFGIANSENGSVTFF